MGYSYDSNGVKYNGDSISLSLDPKIAHDGINFTSHAHMDHLPSARSSEPFCAHTMTVEIAMKSETVDIQNNIQHYDGVEMIKWFSILGGRGLLFMMYFILAIFALIRPGITCCHIPKCSTLIWET